jgi:hypothetical protein
MEFLVINKSVKPAKVAKIDAASVEDLQQALDRAGISDFSAYLNISDSALSALLETVASLEARVFKLEANTPEPGPKPAVFAIDESDNPPGLSREVKAVDQNQQKLAPVTVLLIKKTLIPTNPHAGIFEPKIAFSIDIRNKTSQIVRGVKGDLVFSDLFGADIFTVSVTVNNKIKPNGTARWDGEMVYNQFIPAHVHFGGFKVEDLKIRIEHESVVYG